MFVEFSKKYRGHAAGSSADLPEAEAKAAIDAGAAKEGKAVGMFRQTTEKDGKHTTTIVRAPVGEGEGEQVMLLHFRHSATVEGESYAAGQKAAVPVGDEAWACVNEGHADLDPPPGVAGQPFPPEEVRRDESSDVPAPQLVAAAAQPGVLNPHAPAGMAPAATPKPVPPGRTEAHPANQPPAEKRAAMEEAAKSQARKDAK